MRGRWKQEDQELEVTATELEASLGYWRPYGPAIHQQRQKLISLGNSPSTFCEQQLQLAVMVLYRLQHSIDGRHADLIIPSRMFKSATELRSQFCTCHFLVFYPESKRSLLWCECLYSFSSSDVSENPIGEAASAETDQLMGIPVLW